MKLEGRAGSGAAGCSGLGFDAVIGFAHSATQSTILIAGGENQKPGATTRAADGPLPEAGRRRLDLK
jgi:hypothetical protein